MKKTSCKRGFTLIELLVVVLIIGILASVALPQYQQAVRKVRMMEAVTQVENVMRAIDIWLLSNPNPTCPANGKLSLETLGISLPQIKGFKKMEIRCQAHIYNPQSTWHDGIVILLMNRKQAYELYSQFEGKKWRKRCFYDDSYFSYSRKLCESLRNSGYESEWESIYPF